MARRLLRTGGDAQVTPDALLARRNWAPMSLDEPVSEARKKGTEPLYLFGGKGRRSVFDELGLDLVLCSQDDRIGSPRIVFDHRVYTVNSVDEDMKGSFGSTALFTETVKMACPSFSLPAGPTYEMGTCPSANQSKKGGLREAGKMFTCSGCVAGETLVLVQGEGLVRIDELAARGTEVVVWSGKGWRKTRAQMTSPSSPLVRIETSFGYSIRLTEDHRVLLAAGEFVEAGALGKDMALAFEPPEEAPFPKNARLPVQIPDGQRHHGAVENHFPKDWNYDIGVFLGYILGDGTISYGEYPSVRLISSEEDRSDLEKIRTFVSGWCSTEAVVNIHTEKPNKFCEDPDNMASISWRVGAVFDLVDGLGLDKRLPPSERRAPPSIFKASLDAVRGFLTGLFSTDGSVLVHRGDHNNKTSVVLASVSRGLLQDVQVLLSTFGIRSTICAYETSNKEREENGHLPLWKLDISSYWHSVMFLEKIGFFNERKQRKLKDAVISHPIRGTSRDPSPRVLDLIAEEKAEPVYDLLNVGDEHQFVANGLSVHNCYALEGNYIYANVAMGQAARLHWVRRMLKEDPSGDLLGDLLGKAIDDFARNGTLASGPDGVGSRLVLELGVQEGGQLKVPIQLPGVGEPRLMPVRTTLPPSAGLPDTDAFRAQQGVRDGEVTGFFRIHDSGDFGVLAGVAAWKAYLHAWIRVAEALPSVQFWAPTRMWMWSGLAETVRSAPPNLVVRASALHVGDPSPEIDGFPAGSTVLDGPTMARLAEGWTGAEGDVWPCPVYSQAKKEDKSCMGVGCRACWLWKNTATAYKWH